MKRLPVAPAPVAAFLLLAGCGAAASSQPDPQQPLPAGRADAPSKVVICPDGSSYDPVHNVCIATGAQRPASSSASTSDASSTAEVRIAALFHGNAERVLGRASSHGCGKSRGDGEQ